MPRNAYVYRRRDVRAHFRTLFFSPLLFGLSIFLGKLAFATANRFPFGWGTTTLLGILSFISLVLAILLITGLVSIEDDPNAQYY